MKRLEREVKKVNSNLLYKPTPIEETKLTKYFETNTKQTMNSNVDQCTTSFTGGDDSLRIPPNSPNLVVIGAKPESHSGSDGVKIAQHSKSDSTTDSMKQTDKSVLVNLSQTENDSFSEKQRLSRLLQQVNQMRQLRNRHNSYASSGSFEARNETIKGVKLSKVARGKRVSCIKLKYKVYDFLKRPATIWAFLYHVMAFMLVSACLVVSIYPNVEHMRLLTEQFGDHIQVLDLLEKIVLLWYTAEYLLRLWASDCRPRYQGWKGKLTFVKTPSHILDLLVVILSAIVSIWNQNGHEVFAFRAFRGFHRFFQIIQVIFVKRQIRPWRLFLSVLYDQREQLMIIFYLEIVISSILAYLGFLAEHEVNDDMQTIADFVWWSIVTLTTVGYGDKVPITHTGKAISAIFILFGFCMFALPAGIIGAGLALKLEEVERYRQRCRKKNTAACLIQSAYKCYRANDACKQLELFVGHQSGDHYKMRLSENISLAFITTVQFHVAKTHFKMQTKSVDVRGVIESFKYGQMDIYARLKHLNTALDIVISRMSLADRERMTSISHLSKALGMKDNDWYGSHPNRQVVPASLVQTQTGNYLLSKDQSARSGKQPMIRVYDLVHIPNWNNSLFNRALNYPQSTPLDSHERPQSLQYKNIVPIRSINKNDRQKIPFIDENISLLNRTLRRRHSR